MRWLGAPSPERAASGQARLLVVYGRMAHLYVRIRTCTINAVSRPIVYHGSKSQELSQGTAVTDRYRSGAGTGGSVEALVHVQRTISEIHVAEHELLGIPTTCNLLT